VVTTINTSSAELQVFTDARQTKGELLPAFCSFLWQQVHVHSPQPQHGSKIALGLLPVRVAIFVIHLSRSVGFSPLDNCYFKIKFSSNTSQKDEIQTLHCLCHHLESVMGNAVKQLILGIWGTSATFGQSSTMSRPGPNGKPFSVSHMLPTVIWRWNLINPVSRCRQFGS